MSRSQGTGSPVWFRCHRDRLGDYHGRESRIELTGRQRPAKFKRGHPPGLRSTFIEREYRCTCGHVGWSNHIDLARMAGESRYKGTQFEGMDQR